MKRCPSCNRVEADDALAFCRADGARLVRESREGDGTLRLSPAPVAGETGTRALPAGEPVGRPIAPTTVLDGPRSPGSTRELSKPKSRKAVVVATASVAAIALAASAFLYLARAKNGVGKNSIAVLPFQNASGDPNMEYLSDGITESLINSLSQLPNVRVLARSTMFRFKGHDADPQAVGKELGVEAVLTGRVVQVGDSLNVQADLVSVADGSQLWGDQYKRKAADVLAVQEEITREIITRLRPKLNGGRPDGVNKRYTENPQAYELYLKGRFYWNKRTPQDLQRAAGYFQQASALDPNYALAYTGLADSYIVLQFSGDFSAESPLRKAEEAATKALEIDETLAEAHTSLGAIRLDAYWDFAGAEREYRRAVELNPNYSLAHKWLGELLVITGRTAEGLTEMRRAQETDPLSLPINTSLGQLQYYAGQYDAAVEQLRKTLELEPNFAKAHTCLGNAYVQKGLFQEAAAEYKTATSSEKDNSEALAGLGYAYAASGDRAQAQRVLQAFKERLPHGDAPSYHAAIVCAGLGDADQAFDWLERAYRQHSGWLEYLRIEPRFNRLRSDPRFAGLVRRVGLPQ